MPMPWKIVELPYRYGTKSYKVYNDGLSVEPTLEELEIWKAVEELRAELAAAKAAAGTEQPAAQASRSRGSR